MSHEEALIELTKRFFASHGPATVQDLAWWSSLTIADVKKGIGLADLQCIEVENSTFYSVKSSDDIFHSPVVHLLPNFDEYVIAYKNRNPFTNLQLDKAPSYEELSAHFVTLDGQVVGGWKRAATPKSFTIQLNLFRKLLPEQLDALEATASRLQKFLGFPVSNIDLSYTA